MSLPATSLTLTGLSLSDQGSLVLCLACPFFRFLGSCFLFVGTAIRSSISGCTWYVQLQPNT